MKVLRPLTTLRALVGVRKRPVRVLTVASQISTTARVAHGQTPFTIERSGVDWVEQSDPGLALLAAAVGWWDAREYVSGGTLPNAGAGGSSLDAQIGSTSGSDSNDPRTLTHSGANYLWLPGSNNNRIWLRSPKVAATYTVTYLDDSTASGAHTFDVDCRMFIQNAGNLASVTVYDAEDEPIWTWVADEWESGDSLTQLPARIVGTPNLMTNPGFEDADVYSWSSAGYNAATSSAISSEQAHSGTYSRKIVLPGSTNWEGSGIATNMRGYEPLATHTVTAWVYRESGSGPIALTFGMESGAYTRNTVTATAPAGEWEQITVSGSADSGGGMFIGFHNTVAGGAVTFFVDDITITQDAPARTAEVWRDTAGAKATFVVAPTLLLGTDDFMVVAHDALLDFGPGQDFTVLVAGRQWASLANGDFAGVGKRQSHYTGLGWSLTPGGGGGVGTAAFQIGDGTTNDIAQGVSTPGTEGEAFTIAGVRDTGEGTIAAYRNGVSVASNADGTNGDLRNSLDFIIGRVTDPWYAWDIEMFLVAVWDRVLTAEELADVHASVEAVWT